MKLLSISIQDAKVNFANLANLYIEKEGEFLRKIDKEKDWPDIFDHIDSVVKTTNQDFQTSKSKASNSD